MRRWLTGSAILILALSARAAFALASGDMPELVLCCLRVADAEVGDRLAQNMSKRKDKAKSEDDDEDDSADGEDDSSDDDDDNEGDDNE
jgi:hypothetical protein